MEFLVIDSNAIIRGAALNLFKSAKSVVTTQDVLDEIRDSASRELLERLPYEIEVMNPAEEDLRAVAIFAVKSGDFAALSKTDLRIIALTKTLYNRFHQKVVAVDATAVVANNTAIVASANQLRSAVAVLPVKSAWDKPVVVEQVTTDTEGETERLFQDDAFPALSSGPIFEDGDEEEQELDARPENDEHEHELGMEQDNQIDDVESEDNDDETEESENENESEIIVDEQNERNVDDTQGNGSRQVVSEEGTKSESFTAPLVTIAPSNVIADLISSSCGCDVLHSDEQQLSAAELAEFTPVLSHNRHSHASTSQTGRSKRKEAKRQHALENRSTTSSRITSSTRASTGTRRKLTKDEANDDGVGWISVTNMDQASQITRWTAKAVAKKASDLEGPSIASSAQGQAKVNQSTTKTVPKASSATKSAASQAVTNETKVACCTSDFAMQNVLLQLGLVVISVDGLRVRRLRTAVLRCNACYHVHSGSAKELTRIFCAKCGGNTLSRVNATLGADGTIELHLKKGYTLSTKGTQYSMPAPGKQPRFQGELLTREDQLLSGIWKQKTLRVKKEVKSVFGEDVTSEVGLHLNKGFDVKVGLGKQNPNAKKGRERRGKRKVNNAIK